MRVYDDILQTIGKTPLVRLKHLAKDLPCPVYAKVEYFNPGGSVKDRIAVNIIEQAERSGRLKPGGTVVEATSGNTGLGLAMVCAIKGYKAVFVLPDKMSQEKIQLLRAYGARVVITPTAVAPDDPRSNISVSKRIVEETPNAILANQYHNPENPRSHYLTTGPEIWEQTGGMVTDVVIGDGHRRHNQRCRALSQGTKSQHPYHRCRPGGIPADGNLAARAHPGRHQAQNL